ncbi:MAG TPA: tetratricopeptide repeat protein [Syntrophorhabdaceae bacterium]|nr:tetratricopeptide repeat protein [Syntrophorhabdaceae bacterium]HOL04778.1 tetratricopeptide repeat protein [Syntrophorhabdaceae bacterium]HON85611.1 tetratricopeptide repeat protein [Syntrophorhabdaceae bacterium]HPC65877.1 tetratricopeptide repeat protein [Syntrophorhabdaceae bacterium]HPP40900.1 tetratricopeptide repeat protein [Syntrophorhabdaceae bacterium]
MTKKITILLMSLHLLFIAYGCSDTKNEGPSAKDYYNKAYHFIDAGFPQEAIQLYTLAIEKDPEFIDAYYNRGVTHFTLREYKQALSDLNKVIEKRPDMAIAYASRGSVYDKMGDGYRALKDFKKAAQLGDRDTQDYLRAKNIKW